jgi:deazaflavin-dependent oxidoreductase (nitroreductase family)
MAAFTRSPARHALHAFITPLDRFVFHASRRRLKLSAAIMPSLVLYSTGAKSGVRRETPLICFPRPHGHWYVVGSNFGMPTHPAWTANLIANPAAEIHYRREFVTVRARMLEAAEREDVWPSLEEEWPGYRDYEKTALRDIRIFDLERTR